MEGVGVEGCTVNPLAIEKGGFEMVVWTQERVKVTAHDIQTNGFAIAEENWESFTKGNTKTVF